MTNLTAALPRTYELGEITHLPVKASSAIFEGSAIGLDGGYARQLVAGDRFVGFAVDDAPAVGSDGAANVRVRSNGEILLTITSVAVTDIGKAVYASTGNAFTLTRSTNSHIGRVVRVHATNIAVVAFDGNRAGLGGAITELTDNSGGTASNTIADVPGTYTEATLANQIASLTAKVNEIIRQLG